MRNVNWVASMRMAWAHHQIEQAHEEEGQDQDEDYEDEALPGADGVRYEVEVEGHACLNSKGPFKCCSPLRRRPEIR